MAFSLLLAVSMQASASVPVDGQAAGFDAALVPSVSEAAGSDDPFALLTALDDDRMRELSGRGALYAVDPSAVRELRVGAFQSNESDIDGSVSNTTVLDSVTGEATGNQISGNSGFTTVFINTGNNVVLQSNIQVNIYTPVSGTE